jgi:type II secretory pathway pseudopilin PulG
MATCALHQRSPFQWIELLAVIAILAILASLLLPALNKAKSFARSVQCQGNLKQLQPAWLQYAGDYDDRVVVSMAASTVATAGPCTRP